MEIAKQKGLPLLKHHLLPRTKGFVHSIHGLKGKGKTTGNTMKWEICAVWCWLVITSVFIFRCNFAKLSDRAANFLKSTDYFSNQENSSVAQKYLFDEVHL